jgi:hypothetical protein
MKWKAGMYAVVRRTTGSPVWHHFGMGELVQVQTGSVLGSVWCKGVKYEQHVDPEDLAPACTALLALYGLEENLQNVM